jgi:hypothetical protein
MEKHRICKNPFCEPGKVVGARYWTLGAIKHLEAESGIKSASSPSTACAGSYYFNSVMLNDYSG